MDHIQVLYDHTIIQSSMEVDSRVVWSYVIGRGPGLTLLYIYLTLVNYAYICLIMVLVYGSCLYTIIHSSMEVASWVVWSYVIGREPYGFGLTPHYIGLTMFNYAYICLIMVLVYGSCL